MQRDEHNRKLRSAYERYLADCKVKEDSLHKLETLQGTSGSEAAQQTRRLAYQKLGQLLEHRHSLANRLSSTDMEITMAEFQRDHKEEAAPDALVDIELSKDPMVMKFTERLAGLNQYYADLVAKSRNPRKDRKVASVQQQIQSAEEMLDSRRDVLRPRLIEATLASAVGPSGQRLSLPNLRSTKEYLQKEYDDLETKIDEEMNNLKNLEKFSVEVMTLMEELSAKREITHALRSELDKIEVEQMAPERVIKLDDAVLATSRGDAVRKYVALAFSALLSFGLVVLGVAFVEFQARKVNSVHEVHDGLGIHVMGELPSVSGRVWKRVKGGKGAPCSRP